MFHKNIIMKELLKTNKIWFVVAYVVGLLYLVLYFVTRNNSDAEFANLTLTVMAHIAFLVAIALDKKGARRKLLFRTFSLWIAVFGIVLFFTPMTLGLVAGYFSYAAIGYIQVNLISGNILEYIPGGDAEVNPEKEETLSPERWKKMIWIITTLVPLICYWNI